MSKPKQAIQSSISSEHLARLALGQLSSDERLAVVDQLLADGKGPGQWRMSKALAPAAERFVGQWKQSHATTQRHGWWFALPATAAALVLLVGLQQAPDTLPEGPSLARADALHNASFETDRELFTGRFE